MLATSPAPEVASPDTDLSVDGFLDPIFGAIAENVRCYALYDAAITRRARIEEKFGEDSPKAEKAEDDENELGDHAREALEALIGTAPTTREGFFALLEHLPTRACYGGAGGSGPDEDDFLTICQTLAEGLSNIGRRR